MSTRHLLVLATLATATFSACTCGGPQSTEQLVFTAQPASATAGASLGTVTVTVRDSDGNTVTAERAISLQLADNAAGGVLAGTATATTVNGVATFDGLEVERAGTGYTLTAHSDGVEPVTSAPFDISAGPAAQLAFTSQPTELEAGAVLAPAVAVKLTDAFANPVSGVTLTLVIGENPGDATLSGTTMRMTGADGIATFDDLSLDKAADGYTLIAQAQGVAPASSQAFKVRAGQAVALEFLVSPPGQGTAGVVFSPEVKVLARDARGNAIDRPLDVSLTLSGGTNGATLFGTLTAPVTHGVAVFADLSVDRVGQGYTLHAVADGTAGTDSAPFAISAAAPASVAFTQQPTDAQAGSVIAPAVSVAVRDAFGNAIDGAQVTVALSANPGGATLSGTKTGTTVSGAAAFAELSLDKVGQGYTLTASSGALAPVTSSAFAVRSGAAATVAFSVQPPSTGTAGAALSPAIEVEVLDALGNRVTTATSVNLSLQGGTSGATLGGTASVATVNGVASFSNLTVDRAGTGYTLAAAVTGTTGATSSSFAIGAAAPSVLVFTAQPPAEATSDQAMGSVKVQARDAFGNVATTAVTVNLSLQGGTPGAVLGGTKSAATVGGEATFADLTVDLAGTGYQLAASATGLTGATSTAFAVVAGAPAQLAFGTQPSNVEAGATMSPAVTVHVRDAAGNDVDGESVTLAVTGGAATLSGTTTAVTTGGAATFSSLSLTKAGTGYTLTASSGTLTPVASTTFEVTSAAASSLAFAVSPPAQVTSLQAISPDVKVEARDTYGNLVSQPVAISLALQGGTTGAVLGGTVSGATSAGVAAFSTLTVDKAGTGYSLVASATGPGDATSTAFEVLPGSAAAVAFLIHPSSPVVAGTLFGTVVRVTDAAGNGVTGADVTVSAELPGVTLGGTLLKSTTTGTASFDDLLIDKAGTGYTLKATVTGLTPATSNAFDVEANVPAALVFVTQPPATATSGAELAPAPVVEVRDAFANPVLTDGIVDVAVALSGGDAAATLSGTKSQPTLGGLATFSGLSVDLAGTNYVLTATSPGLTVTSSAFSVLAGSPASVVFLTQPAPSAAGSAFSFTAEVRDGAGNRAASSASITVALGNNPTGATLSGTKTVAASAGLATFSGLSLDKAGTGYTLVLSASGLSGDTSAPFDVSAVALSGLVYDEPTSGRIRLLRNPSSTATVVYLDLVAMEELTGYAVGFNLPLDATKITTDASLLTPGSALPAGTSPVAAKAVLPTTGPLASVLVSGQSQKAAGTGAVTIDTLIPAGSVLYTVKLNAAPGATPGVIFDGAALGPKFRARMRDRMGTDVVTAADFRIGKLTLY